MEWIVWRYWQTAIGISIYQDSLKWSFVLQILLTAGAVHYQIFPVLCFLKNFGSCLGTGDEFFL